MYGLEPDLTREGGSIPITLTLEEVSGKNVMLLPIGSGDDGAHSQNEKINRTNYLKGVSRYVYTGVKMSSGLKFVAFFNTLTAKDGDLRLSAPNA